MSKNIIVTGGLGFIGSNLIELLLKKNYRVLNIDKVSYSSNFYNVKKFKSSKNIPLSKIDSNKKIDKNLTCYVYCAGGYRSVIACSILRRDRFKELVNIESGFSGISKLI